MSRTGPVEQPHLRPWATALSAPTDTGRVWMKAVPPAMAVELRIYPLLRAAAPANVLQPIAIRPEQGWILLPDGGRVLGEALAGSDLVDAMERTLVAYGQLQRAMTRHVPALLAAGVADMRAPETPGRFEEALRAAEPLVARADAPEARATLVDLPALAPRLAEWARALTDAPGEPSIDHNDLHPWNVFAGEPPVLFDWGDSVVAHPFASMLVPLDMLGGRLGADEAALRRVRDAYLEVFSDLAPQAELVETLELACRVAKVARALVWARALATAEDEEREHLLAPLETLASMRDASDVGGAPL